MAKRKKTSNNDTAQLGNWIFLAGIVVAVLAGLVITNMAISSEEIISYNTWIYPLLGFLGLMVGLINISMRDEVPFLIATTVLLLGFNSLNVLPIVGDTLSTILYYTVVFVAPAGLVVALKSIYAFAKA